jgi:hypothetical protein
MANQPERPDGWPRGRRLAELLHWHPEGIPNPGRLGPNPPAALAHEAVLQRLNALERLLQEGNPWLLAPDGVMTGLTVMDRLHWLENNVRTLNQRVNLLQAELDAYRAQDIPGVGDSSESSEPRAPRTLGLGDGPSSPRDAWDDAPITPRQRSGRPLTLALVAAAEQRSLLPRPAWRIEPPQSGQPSVVTGVPSATSSLDPSM